MRSATFVQAFQYWLKLTALPCPPCSCCWPGRRRRRRAGRPGVRPARPGGLGRPLSGLGPHPLYTTYALILATFLGTMGLPHVLVRFYTNPDGRAARRTTLVVLGLLGVFYLLPPLYGALGRLYAPELLPPAAPTPSCSRCRCGCRRDGGELLPRCSSRAPSRRSCRRRRACRRDRRRARAGPARAGGSAASRRSGCAACRGGGGRLVLALLAGTRRATRSSGSRSPWPRRRSARCWCWASGGAG